MAAGSSGALAQQILNGAQVDIFISANHKLIDKLEKKDLVMAEQKTAFLGNELAVIVPADSSIELFESFFRGS